MKKYSNNESGRSMIEMLGVLAIVGVLSVAGIAGYSKAMSKYKINKAMDQVSTLAANIKTMFASTGNYDGLTGNDRAMALGLFPEEMVKTGTPYNALNGTVTVAPGTNGTTFTIAFAGLNKEACTALATSDWGGSSGYKGLKVGDEAVASFSDAASKCGDDKTITWTFF